MGESVAEAFQKNSTGRVTIVHVNGAFHSDFGEGTAESARRRMPGRRIAVVTMIPVDDLDTTKPDDDDFKRADYLVYTIRMENERPTASVRVNFRFRPVQISISPAFPRHVGHHRNRG